MAKTTRVYELARDLNMTNKDLLEKLKEIDITVGSHMSSLDEEAVAAVKTSLRGKEKTSQIEEIRVKPTVIRRRKKVVKAKPVEAEPEQAEAVAEEAAPDETAAAEVPAEEAAQPVEPEKPVTLKKKKAQTAAKIVAPPDDVKPAEPEEEKPDTAEIASTESSESAIAEEPEKPAEKKAAPKTAPKTAPAKKRAKKEAPAKIIKLGPAPELEEPARKRAARADRRRPGTGPAPGAAPPDESRKAKRGAEDRKDKKSFKKRKISFRKREIVEGAALYSKSGRGRRGRKKVKGKQAFPGQKTQITTAKAIKRRIKIDDSIVLSELAKRMGIKANEMIAKLMGLGVMATVNQTIDFETAVLVAAEFEYEVERLAFEEETLLKAETDDPATLVERAPVVTIMGHVDHGKTSLLDVVRKSSITSDEAGGITQHIGAYNVSTDKGRIAFLDTPGHEAFTAMRSRGAKITDIVILVVAADDGVMPQTIEAINHSKAAEVPIIVAINKMDKPGADPERVTRELAENGLSPEDWGGDTIFVQVSAKEKTGIDSLLDMVLLQSEMLELKANPEKLAVGHVVEAKLDTGRGAVATVLVQQGTLHTGDPVVCGIHHGKIRGMISDGGQSVNAAGPSMPVEIIGLSGVPNAGDEFIAVKDEKAAKQVSLHRSQKQRSKDLAKSSRMSLDNLFEKMQEGEVKDLNLIIRADVQGSIEALTESLVKLSNEEVKINIVQAATGTITETDVSLATVSDAIIIGFNVRPNTKVQALANEEQVDMRFYNIIYNVINEVESAILGMMESTYKEHVLGRAEVRQVFHVPKIGAIAGSYVTDGKIERNQMMRLLREGVIQYEGRNSSLRRFKDDVKEVQGGYECGIGIESYNDIKVDDVIECYYLEEVKPTL
ncbi:MAG: translation initiation factor IF-2 [Desulfobacterales bacterium]|nr:translation initiation factor IF-2 [Desulfobacterales bacterium]